MTEVEYLEKVKAKKIIKFADLISIIENNYIFTPTKFTNGEITNQEEENQGSAKLLAFASIHKLNKKETLSCFAEHYQQVLDEPNSTNHSNIRNFMKTGWNGVYFVKFPLQKK